MRDSIATSRETQAEGPTGTPLLEVRGLRVTIPSAMGLVEAVRGVNLDVWPGEVLGVVGESGSGKSLTAKAIMRLLQPPVRVESGQVLYEGEDVIAMTSRRLNQFRGGDAAMVFQSAGTALNPLMRVGDQIAETLRNHSALDRRTAQKRAIHLLERVGIPAATARARSYPHEFSGGMAQRVMIAAAIANESRILIADEPTTAVDSTTQAQIIELLMELNAESGMAIILITHDLGLVARIAARVYVMYAGRVVETASTQEIFSSPAHPYTRGLLGAAPNPHIRRGERLVGIDGVPPDPGQLPVGCSFQPRCAWSRERCGEEEPVLLDLPGSQPQQAACWFASEIKGEPLTE